MIKFKNIRHLVVLIIIILVLNCAACLAATKGSSGDNNNENVTSSGGYMLSTLKHVNIRGGSSKNVVTKAVGTVVKYGGSAELSFSGSSITAGYVSQTTSASIALGIKQSPGLVSSISVTIYPENVEMPSGDAEPQFPPPPYIVLTPNVLDLEVGETKTVKAQLKNAGKNGGSFRYSVVDSSIARVSTNGNQYIVIGQAEGETVLTCYVNGYQDISTSCKIRVRAKGAEAEEFIPITGISLPKYKDMIVGESTRIAAVISPSNATDPTVDWVSSDSSVVAVSGGRLEAKKIGSAQISATKCWTDADGKLHEVIGSCTVFVKDDHIASGYISSVAISGPKEVEVNKIIGLTANVQPTFAENHSVTWTSSNPEIARVSSFTGLVCGYKVGEATITATSKADPTVSDSVVIKVVDKNSKLEFKPASTRLLLQGKDRIEFSDWALYGNGKKISKDKLNSNFIFSVSGSDRSHIFVSNGNIVATGKGKVTVTATAKPSSEYNGSATMTIEAIDGVEYKLASDLPDTIYTPNSKWYKDKYVKREVAYNWGVVNAKTGEALPIEDFEIECSDYKATATHNSIIVKTDNSSEATFTVKPKDPDKYVSKGNTKKVNIVISPGIACELKCSLGSVIDLSNSEDKKKDVSFTLVDSQGNELSLILFTKRCDSMRVRIRDDGTGWVDLSDLDGIEDTRVVVYNKDVGSRVVKLRLVNLEELMDFDVYGIDYELRQYEETGTETVSLSKLYGLSSSYNSILPSEDFKVWAESSGPVTVNGNSLIIPKNLLEETEVTVKATTLKPEYYINETKSDTIKIRPGFNERRAESKTYNIPNCSSVSLSDEYNWKIVSGGGTISDNTYKPGSDTITAKLYGLGNEGYTLKEICYVDVYTPKVSSIYKKIYESLSISEVLSGVPESDYSNWSMELVGSESGKTTSYTSLDDWSCDTIRYYYNGEDTGLSSSISIITEDLTYWQIYNLVREHIRTDITIVKGDTLAISDIVPQKYLSLATFSVVEVDNSEYKDINLDKISGTTELRLVINGTRTDITIIVKIDDAAGMTWEDD